MKVFGLKNALNFFERKSFTSRLFKMVNEFKIFFKGQIFNGKLPKSIETDYFS